MKKWEERYDFNWLPGYKEMMACQNGDAGTEDDGTAAPAEREAGPEPAMENLLPPEMLQQEEKDYWEDYSYMLRMLPAAAREIWVVSDALLDQYEYEGSAIYVEYPDKETIRRIADQVYEKLSYYETEATENRVDGTEGKNVYYIAPEDRTENTPFRQLIFVILCWNMAYRRQRYYRRRKIFPLSY